MSVVYGALGDSIDLTIDVIFMLYGVVGLNMCVGCECVHVWEGLRVFARVQILKRYKGYV
jgi:hypothetical protein